MEQFVFKGFEPIDAVKAKAERMYERVCEMAPIGSRVIAQLEWDGELYHCSVEVGSNIYPTTVGVAHRLPAIAIDKTELALARKLAKWHDFRFTPLQGKSRHLIEV